MKTFFRKWYAKLLLLLFLFALVTRLGNLFAALDYDEIWTMTYFSAKDFSFIYKLKITLRYFVWQSLDTFFTIE